ncbi:TenA family protein [Wolbachia endosymbiont of Ctenocephalides felis wCfeJ]|uniref:TenA family protein n=1 Tax=Wolbachia endosymbiont of Ctenocephalides felis wCfeJ TaxID=2732594 RepID=UPI0014454F3B|nr:TenA family protein [Wolbachia endosymbiont of Ctenocephalides felis wCfeJ]WCR58160.1 MAG: Aminopyrimidine aminohydrolase [Wolbachia endosymbiont of Ctenocephalides felis wCfeJ]
MFSGIIRSCYGSSLLRDIAQHPFNVELMNNTLNIESFKFYIQQDALFLDDYVRTMLIIASRMEDYNNVILLAKVAQGTITANKFLYNHYFTIYDVRRGKKSPTCFNFTNFLLSISYSDIYEAITVLYSCMFIYKIVIDDMKGGFKKNNRYKDWFDFCSSGLMEYGCTALENIVDEYCKRVGVNERSRMLELFRMSAQFELDFWDSAYNFPKFNQVPKEH